MNLTKIIFYVFEYSLLALIIAIILLCENIGYSRTFETVKDNVVIRDSYYAESESPSKVKSEGDVVTVTGIRLNLFLNFWYQLDNGKWVFGENVVKHICENYSVGLCTGCVQEWPYVLESMPETTYTVIKEGGSNIRSRPYEDDANVVKNEDENSRLIVIGSIVNERGNIWYLLSSENWVYSGNVVKSETVS